MTKRPKRPSKHAAIYPWEDWFSRDVFDLTRGIDYLHRTDTMAQMVRRAARRVNKSVSIDVAANGRSLTVRVN